MAAATPIEEVEKENKRKKSKKGLANATPETVARVSKAGGLAAHRSRGLAAVTDLNRLKQIATLGGKARAKDLDGLRLAGAKGGNVVKATYGGVTYYKGLGKKGGTITARDRSFMAEIGRKGGSKVAQIYGYEYYAEIGRKRRSSSGSIRRKRRDNNNKCSVV